jgi:hypothetical protein
MAESAAQIDLFAWAEELEREQGLIAEANRARSERRGFLVFATDPEAGPDAPDYRRRLRAYLATGQYRHELANARWVA